MRRQHRPSSLPPSFPPSFSPFPVLTSLTSTSTLRKTASLVEISSDRASNTGEMSLQGPHLAKAEREGGREGGTKGGRGGSDECKAYHAHQCYVT